MSLTSRTSHQAQARALYMAASLPDSVDNPLPKCPSCSIRSRLRRVGGRHWVVMSSNKALPGTWLWIKGSEMMEVNCGHERFGCMQASTNRGGNERTPTGGWGDERFDRRRRLGRRSKAMLSASKSVDVKVMCEGRCDLLWSRDCSVERCPFSRPGHGIADPLAKLSTQIGRAGAARTTLLTRPRSRQGILPNQPVSSLSTSTATLLPTKAFLLSEQDACIAW